MARKKEVRFNLNRLDRERFLNETSVSKLQSFNNAFVEYAMADVPVTISFVYKSLNRMYFVVRRAKNKFHLTLLPLSDDAWFDLLFLTINQMEKEVEKVLSPVASELKEPVKV